MKSYALVKKEWKLLKWVMLLFGCIFALFTFLLANSMDQEKTYHLLGQYQNSIFMSKLYRVNTGMVPVLIMAIMTMVAVLFLDDRNIYIGQFISSLPCTRKQYFTIKYVMGLMTFTVPLVLFGGVLYIIRSIHLGWMNRIYQYSRYGAILKAQDRVDVLFLVLIFLWLIMFSTYSFLMMVQTLMGQNIVASIVGGIILLVPIFLGYAIPENLELLSIGNIDFPERVFRWGQMFFLGNPQDELIGRVSVIDRYNFMSRTSFGYWTYNYQGFPAYMAILVIGIIITFLLGFYFVQNNDVEKNGEIALYPWVGKLLVIGVTVCSLLLFPIIIVIFTQIESLVLTVIAMIVGGVLGYFISSKSIELTTKHG